MSCYEGPAGASFFAVKRCCEAWNRAVVEATEQHMERYPAFESARRAYRRVMPFLCGEDNIRGFIAAVGQGMLLGVFSEKEGTKLVYVAQVALSSLPRPVAPSRSKPESTSPETPPLDSGPEPEPPLPDFEFAVLEQTPNHQRLGVDEEDENLDDEEEDYEEDEESCEDEDEDGIEEESEDGDNAGNAAGHAAATGAQTSTTPTPTPAPGSSSIPAGPAAGPVAPTPTPTPGAVSPAPNPPPAPNSPPPTPYVAQQGSQMHQP